MANIVSCGPSLQCPALHGIRSLLHFWPSHLLQQCECVWLDCKQNHTSSVFTVAQNWYLKKKTKKKLLYICSKTIKNLNNQGAFVYCKLNATPLLEGTPWQIKTALIHEDVLSMSSAAIYHHPISQSRGDAPQVNHPCSGLNCWTLIIESGLVEKKTTFFPADTALTHPLFLFLTASVTLSPPLAALPVFSVDFNQNPLPVFWKCQGVAVVRMSRWLLRIQYIKRVFTALQLGSAFSVSSSAVCLEKGRNGKLPRVCRQFRHSAYSLNSLAVHSILLFFFSANSPCRISK